jgi:phosphoglucosamine mutase
MGKLFGTDGVRGVANVYPMTAEITMQIGRAVAHYCKHHKYRHRIVIGKDTRLSGYMIENALVAGICSMGVDALLVGPMPTPAISFITTDLKADAGIVISASHNPFQDNGIKIFNRDGYKLPDDVENQIEEMIFSKSIDALRPTAEEVGKAFRIDDARGRYITFLKKTFPNELNLEGLKIVIDCGNGATYKIAPCIFEELGARVIIMNANPDGKNINANCGALHPEVMAREVIKEKADVGLAFDGDGDRCIAADEKGDIVTGDQMLAICTNTLKKEGRLKNDILISTVMSNLGLTMFCKKLNIGHATTNVGDRYVLEEMLKKGAIIGGEDSGHIIFLDYHNTGDGLISALQLLASLKKENKPFSQVSQLMKVYPQNTINVTVKSKPELSAEAEIMQAVRGAENELQDQGRILVRYSGTQMLCRVMVEAATQELADTIAKRVAEVVKNKLS